MSSKTSGGAEMSAKPTTTARQNISIGAERQFSEQPVASP